MEGRDALNIVLGSEKTEQIIAGMDDDEAELMIDLITYKWLNNGREVSDAK